IELTAAPGVGIWRNVLVTLAMPKPPPAIVPPESSELSALLLSCGSKQKSRPLAAIGSETALLSSPPALTCTEAKQSGAMSAGSVKLICHSPGNPDDAPAYSGVICLPLTMTLKLPACVWSPEVPPVSLAASAPPPVPHNTSVSPACAGVSVQLKPLNDRAPLVKRVRLSPPLTLPMVACAVPVPALLEVAIPKLRATTVTFCGALESVLEVTGITYVPGVVVAGRVHRQADGAIERRRRGGTAVSG